MNPLASFSRVGGSQGGQVFSTPQGAKEVRSTRSTQTSGSPDGRQSAWRRNIDVLSAQLDRFVEERDTEYRAAAARVALLESGAGRSSGGRRLLESRATEIESLLAASNETASKAREARSAFETRVRALVSERKRELFEGLAKARRGLLDSLGRAEEASRAKLASARKAAGEARQVAEKEAISAQADAEAAFEDLQRELESEVVARGEMQTGVCDLMKCIVAKVSDQLEEEKQASEETANRLLNELDETLAELESVCQ